MVFATEATNKDPFPWSLPPRVNVQANRFPLRKEPLAVIFTNPVDGNVEAIDIPRDLSNHEVFRGSAAMRLNSKKYLRSSCFASDYWFDRRDDALLQHILQAPEWCSRE